MSISSSFVEPLYEGGGTSDLVPSLYPVALDGRSYLVDLKSGEFRRRSVPVLRNQADTTNLPGEQSLNPEELWRRSQESWHLGAGQRYFDRPDSNPNRFYASRGVNPWDKWKLTLLNSTDLARASASAAVVGISAGDRYYLINGTQPLEFTADITAGIPSWTTVTGGPAAAPTSITSDGEYVYTSHSASGVYRSAVTATTSASFDTGAATLVAWVKGRLMAVNGVSVGYITAVNTRTAVSFSANLPTTWTWVGFAEGQNSIYAAGYAGDKSIIFRIGIKSDGTGLDVGLVAAELPDGEVVRGIVGYLGYVVVGTDRGIRFAAADSAGNLTLGSLISTPGVVRCFEPQDRFVWFNWDNFATGVSGTGRLDLSTFIAPMTPAYASDLMYASAGGTVTSIVTTRNRRVFTIASVGAVRELTTPVASGYVDSGRITYGIPDEKVGTTLEIRHDPLDGSITAYLVVDTDTLTEVPAQSLGSSDVEDSTRASMSANELTGEFYNLRIKLTAGVVSPVLSRWTFKAQPAPGRAENFVVPLIFRERLDLKGIEKPFDVPVNMAAIRALMFDTRLVSFQLGDENFSVFVEDYEFRPEQETSDGEGWQGLMIVKLKAVS